MKEKKPPSSDTASASSPGTGTLRLRPQREAAGPNPDRFASVKPAVRRKIERVPRVRATPAATEGDAGIEQRNAVPGVKITGQARPPRQQPAGRNPEKGAGKSRERSLPTPTKTGRRDPITMSRPVSAVRPSGPPTLPREDHPDGIRLSKVMADRGMCSRREADALIERGWVFVDGRRISELGVRVQLNVRIVLAPEAKNQQATQVTILLHKPVGYVSGQPEPGYRPAVELIGSGTQFDAQTEQRFHFSHLKGLAPAGRLDIDSTGLLVFTQDGRIARQLIGQDASVEKEYLVRVEGQLIEGGLDLLQHGLMLDDRMLRPARVEWINDDQLRFFLREGRKRQIRRMCEQVGLKVVGLKRVRIGQVRLGDLPMGQWRYLRPDEKF